MGIAIVSLLGPACTNRVDSIQRKKHTQSLLFSPIVFMTELRSLFLRDPVCSSRLISKHPNLIAVIYLCVERLRSNIELAYWVESRIHEINPVWISAPVTNRSLTLT